MIHQLQLSLREKERDLDRLNNLLSHNEETINVSSYNNVVSGNKISNGGHNVCALHLSVRKVLRG